MDELQTWSCLMLALAGFPWFCYVLVIFSFVVSICYSYHSLYNCSNLSEEDGGLPGVSIIKPLMGVDNLLAENLETHFCLKYPKVELLFCVQSSEDPVIEIVRNLQKKFPDVPNKLLIGGKDGVLNPMVHNMALGYEAAQYDLVWVSSARVKVNTNMLLDMVGKIRDPRVALVHQMPYTVYQSHWASALEKVHFGTAIPRYYLACNVLQISCFTGMSYLVKKPELDLINGLPWFGQYIAEDFFMRV